MERGRHSCKRFRRMRVTPAFWAHLKNCPKCTAVIRYLARQVEIDHFLRRAGIERGSALPECQTNREGNTYTVPMANELTVHIDSETI